MTTKEIVDCMLRRMDALSDSMRTVEGACDAHKHAALEGLNDMIEACAKVTEEYRQIYGEGVTLQTYAYPEIAQAIRDLKAENPVYDLDR